MHSQSLTQSKYCDVDVKFLGGATIHLGYNLTSQDADKMIQSYYQFMVEEHLASKTGNLFSQQIHDNSIGVTVYNPKKEFKQNGMYCIFYKREVGKLNLALTDLQTKPATLWSDSE